MTRWVICAIISLLFKAYFLEDWEKLTKKYQDLSLLDDNVLPDWQKGIIDQRLAEIRDNPERLRPIQELFDEMEKD